MQFLLRNASPGDNTSGQIGTTSFKRVAIHDVEGTKCSPAMFAHHGQIGRTCGRMMTRSGGKRCDRRTCRLLRFKQPRLIADRFFFFFHLNESGQ